MTEVRVEVTLDGRDIDVGSLYAHERRGATSTTFVYASGYLSTPGAYALGPDLPLVSATLTSRPGAALFGAFADCAPGAWARSLAHDLARANGGRATSGRATSGRATVRRAASTTGGRAGVGDLLSGRDDAGQGALRFRPGNVPVAGARRTALPTTASLPTTADLPALLDLADRAEQGTVDLAGLERLVSATGSLGGSRPKTHLVHADGRLAIAKLPSLADDVWSALAWEKVALDLAAAVGIAVPASQLLTVAGRRVLVVDRFDRVVGSSDGLAPGTTGARRGYVSARTMLTAADDETHSYLAIAEVVENVSTRATEDLHQLWRQMVFAILVSHTDNRLSHHGFLHERGDGWRLAPAFGVFPHPAPGPTYLSTTIDESDEPASVRAAIAVAAHFRLTTAQARSTLSGMAATMRGWRELARRHGIGPIEIVLMEPAFAAISDVR